jgi:hypothetical protein
LSGKASLRVRGQGAFSYIAAIGWRKRCALPRGSFPSSVLRLQRPAFSALDHDCTAHSVNLAFGLQQTAIERLIL